MAGRKEGSWEGRKEAPPNRCDECLLYNSGNTIEVGKDGTPEEQKDREHVNETPQYLVYRVPYWFTRAVSFGMRPCPKGVRRVAAA